MNLAVLPAICPNLHRVKVLPPDGESTRSKGVSGASHRAKTRHPNVKRKGRKSCVMCGCSAVGDLEAVMIVSVSGNVLTAVSKSRAVLIPGSSRSSQIVSSLNVCFVFSFGSRRDVQWSRFGRTQVSRQRLAQRPVQYFEA